MVKEDFSTKAMRAKAMITWKDARLMATLQTVIMMLDLKVTMKMLPVMAL